MSDDTTTEIEGETEQITVPAGMKIIGVNEIIEGLNTLNRNQQVLLDDIKTLFHRILALESVVATIVLQYPLVDPETGESTADTFGAPPVPPKPHVPGGYL